jgi:hypothetical protein
MGLAKKVFPPHLLILRKKKIIPYLPPSRRERGEWGIVGEPDVAKCSNRLYLLAQ